jgi:nucleoside 2-deoxyribosyltransferase
MFKVYLAGPISGLTFAGAQEWRNEFTRRVDSRIKAYSPLRGKDYLAGLGILEQSYANFPLSTDQGLTTRDRYDCMGADLVVFYLLGAQRISVGTMIEMGWCDAARKPAVLVIEKEGNPHDHPMVRQTVPFRVDNLDDALKVTEIILLNKREASSESASAR